MEGPFMTIGSESAKIKVIGVGGGGGNAVQHMAQTNIEGVEFVCLNTDAQALTELSIGEKVQIGGELTKGLGAGANPLIGAQAATESQDAIKECLKDANMVFVTAGMGGGTGTGAAPIVAEIAKSLGILTVGVVTTPFPFEGKKRMKLALEGIALLKENVDSLITIPNERLLEVLGKKVTLLDAFVEANNVLHGAVQGISDLIVRPGMMNVDFADVKTVMSEMGISMMGTGTASGENRASVAAEMAIYSPLLNNLELNQARGILVNVTGGPDLELGEFSEIGEMIQDLAADDATVVVGTVVDPEMGDSIRVTLVATGLEDEEEYYEPEPVRQPQQAPQYAPQASARRSNVQHRPAPSARPIEQRVQSRPQAQQATPQHVQQTDGRHGNPATHIRPTTQSNANPTYQLREEQGASVQQHPQQNFHEQTARDIQEPEPHHVETAHEAPNKPLRQAARENNGNQNVGRPVGKRTQPLKDEDYEFLDIPAFLRRQND